jgi:hypothetical protein
MEPKDQVAYLKTPKAIREQAKRLFELAVDGKLLFWDYDESKLQAVIKYVSDHIKESYPTLDIPYHSRFRHFDMERLAALTKKLDGQSTDDIAKAKIELAIVSVLLDAGAGTKWTYKSPNGSATGSSEGLAAASFDMFMDGGFSSDPDIPLLCDIQGLKAVDKRSLAEYFQVSKENPLAGFDGRLQLLHKLGATIQSHKKVFGDLEPRLGNIYDYIVGQSANGKISARRVFSAVIEGLGTIWPGRLSLAGVNLGDTWKHPLLPTDDLGSGLMPFHKLSQWLTYSLIEPLEEAGLDVSGLDELTGLAEYRNGGLFVDLEVLRLKNPSDAALVFSPDAPLIVEWRAMTLILLDKIAQGVRESLQRSALELPLARILQGGTWSAGRKIAKVKRSDGSPPIKLASDGTVF